MSNDKIPDYVTFPRTFENYAWYKPIIVFIMVPIMMVIIEGVVMLGIASVFGLDAIRSLSGAGLNSALPIIITDLIIFMFVPALYVASKIVKDRPFSSYSSSRGGWNFKLYFKALIIPLILYIIFQFIEITVNGAKGTYQFSILFLIVIFITVPLRSIAEEFMFRGLLMQTLGSWFKIPVLAIVIQAIIFAFVHGYNSLGFFEILVNGLMWGFFTWKTNGLEVGCALHTANNFSVGLFIMLGLVTSTSSPQLSSVAISLLLQIILFVAMYYVGKKTDWFGEIPQNS